MSVRQIVPADRSAAAKRRRREQDAMFKNGRAYLGEDVMCAILQAVKEKSEQPLTHLPPKWRDKAIAIFREVQSRRCVLQS